MRGAQNKMAYAQRSLNPSLYTSEMLKGISVRRNFSSEGQRRHFAYRVQFADDAKKIDVHKTLCPPYTTTKMHHVTATVTKMRFFGNNNQVHYNNSHNRLSAGFQSRAPLFKEALPCSLTKPQIKDVILPTKTWRHFETRAANVWENYVAYRSPQSLSRCISCQVVCIIRSLVVCSNHSAFLR